MSIEAGDVQVVLISMPPDAFAVRDHQIPKFETYDVFGSFFVGSFADLPFLDLTVIVGLYPRVNVERSDTITAQRRGLVLFDPINCLIPLADVFVAVISTTIPTAVVCRIPCVNFDIHNYDWNHG